MIAVQPAADLRARRRAASCATTNPGTSAGAIPAKLLDSDRATVVAGVAKLVEVVNQ